MRRLEDELSEKQSAEMMSEKFYFPWWANELSRQLRSYRYLRYFVNNERSINSFVFNPIVPGVSRNLDEATKVIFERDIQTAFSSYSQQMIVVVVSYLEDIVSNFLECLLFSNSELLGEYQGKYNNNTRLRNKLDILRSILNKRRIEFERYDELANVLTLRNAIAHNSSGEDVLHEDVESAFSLACNFAVELSQIAKKFNMPIGMPNKS